jgi:phosphoenolpyruvate carboxylase
LSDRLGHEIAFLTGRLDAIIRERAGAGIFRQLHQLCDLSIAGRQQDASATVNASHALKQFAGAKTDALARLRGMCQQWLFFKQRLDNAEMSLAKTERGIAHARKSTG